MDVLDFEIQVRFRYPVYFSRDVFASSNTVLLKAAPSAVAPKPARILFVLDGGVTRRTRGCRTRSAGMPPCRGAQLAAPVLVHPGRRASQERPGAYRSVLQAIHDARLGRHSYVAAIGGGAVLDVVGYAAATAHRGIRLIRFPPRCWRRTTRRSA